MGSTRTGCLGERHPGVGTGVEGGQYWPIDAKVPAQCQEKVESGVAETNKAFDLDSNGAWPVWGLL